MLITSTEYLWRNHKKHRLSNVVKPISDQARASLSGGAAAERKVNTVTICSLEAIGWIKKNKQKPFFLYLPLTIPHANNEGTRMFGDGAEVPEYGIYEKEGLVQSRQGTGAMIA